MLPRELSRSFERTIRPMARGNNVKCLEQAVTMSLTDQRLSLK
jgi:hypothetical protein